MCRTVGSSAAKPSLAEARASIIMAQPIVAGSIDQPAAAPFMAARLTACIPAPSAASIMEATRGHFPHAASQALAGVSMVAEVAAGEVTDENVARNPVK